MDARVLSSPHIFAIGYSLRHRRALEPVTSNLNQWPRAGLHVEFLLGFSLASFLRSDDVMASTARARTRGSISAEHRRKQTLDTASRELCQGEPKNLQNLNTDNPCSTMGLMQRSWRSPRKRPSRMNGPAYARSAGVLGGAWVSAVMRSSSVCTCVDMRCGHTQGGQQPWRWPGPDGFP